MLRVFYPPRFGRVVALVLLCAALLCLPAAVPRAEAASRYHVETWSDWFEDMFLYYYTVCDANGNECAYFYSTSLDEFMNTYSGNDIRVTFYRCESYCGSEERQTMANYLMERSGARQKCWLWYTFNAPAQSLTYLVLIEGANLLDPNLDMEQFQYKSPWINTVDEDLGLMIINIGDGDLVTDNWNWIRNVHGCSAAVYLPYSNAKGGRTVGLSYFDYGTGENVLLYCPDERIRY